MTDLHRIDWFVRNKLLPVAPNGDKLSTVFLRKIKEELRELEGALALKDQMAIEEEYADLYISLLAFGRAVGVHHSKSFAEKMQVNEQRDWRFDGKLGVFKGVK